MSRKTKSIECSEETLEKLKKIVNSRTEEVRIAERARIIVSCLSGDLLQNIAKENKVQQSTVIKWKKRFMKDGINGLQDNPRSGKPKIYDKEFENKVLRTIEQTPPNGMSKWDGPSLAKELDTSDDAIWRVMRKHGICLARQRTWCVSTDPNFSAKAADVIGLYLDPPQNAIVISVDEKPTIQAIERQTGYVKTHNKKTVQGLQSTYKRHGTVNLFAALEVASGQIRGKVTSEKKRVDFLAFMEEVVSDYDNTKEIHVIMDNHSIHKKLDEWQEKHKNVIFHYTPTSASWLNMVEIWFGIFSRKVLNGGSFSSPENLTEKIMKYISAYKEEAHPFVWRKREVVGTQLRDTITNLCN